MAAKTPIAERIINNPWGIAAIGAALLGIAVLAYYAISAALQKIKEPTGTNDLILQPGGLSFSPAEYVLKADSLFAAMNGNGTDHATVLATLKSLKNPADWVALSKAFGMRENTYGGFFGNEGTLLEWLQWEYNDYYNLIGSGWAEIQQELTRLKAA